ncbi:MAG: hypothetical protein EXS36_20555 [Pedosphaera sp.]|nr:hypothetical protein [Pedosphaera sp.]
MDAPAKNDSAEPAKPARRKWWKRWLKIFLWTIGGSLLFILMSAGILTYLWLHGPLQGWLVERMVVADNRSNQQEKPWPPPGWKPGESLPDAVPGPRLSAVGLKTAAELFQTTNIWIAGLEFSEESWKRMAPRRLARMPGFLKSDGTILLSNTNASRNGLAGVVGYEFDHTTADFEFGGVHITNVAARFKGNGTFLSALHQWKKPIKVRINKYTKGRELAGRDTFNFGNLSTDASCLSDSLSYEAFRLAGVPASRTAFVRMFLSIQGQFEKRPLGLYVMVENLDEEFCEERFGSRKTALFKPVTYGLFQDLGNDWSAYQRAYDPKTKITQEQQRRLIETARFVTQSTDQEFAARVGDFFDLDETARFLAALVWMSSYDGILWNGQNFAIYIDPRSDKFGFLPWDLDHSWGEFPGVGTEEQRQQASIRHPWVGKIPFLERMMAVETFRNLYLARVKELHETVFRPERLARRTDELAVAIRAAVLDESDRKAERFEQAVADQWAPRPGKDNPMDPKRPAFPLKNFYQARAISVEEQLAGRSEGVVIKRGWK